MCIMVDDSHTKTCTKCSETKPLTSFHKSGGKLKDGSPKRRGICSACCNKIDRDRYDGNRREYMRQANTRRNEAAWELKRKHLLECLDCGTTDTRVLEFDHVRGEKLFNIGGIRKGMKALEEEIAKCDVVCANCHRIRTYDRDKTWRT
jgi:hypothetical protein